MTPLEAALAYGARGWRVHPLPKARKYPAGHPDWQTNATTDAARIEKHWAANPDDGVCIATGAGSGLFVVDIDPADGGDDSLRALEAQYGPLPDTMEAITGSGGRHLFFAWPDTGGITNNQSGLLGVGIDIRGDGGQVVVAPSVHGSRDCKRCAAGQPCAALPYRWEVMGDPFDGVAPAPAPEWLIELLQTPPGSTQPRRAKLARLATDGVMPGDWWASRTSWPDELAWRGWTLHSTHHDAGGDYYELWTRPGKDKRAGASASLYYGGSDVLKVFSSNAAPLTPESTYTLWGFEVAHAHGGDFEAAARTMRRQMMPAPATTTAQAPTRRTPKPCPHCGSTNTTEKATA